MIEFLVDLAVDLVTGTVNIGGLGLFYMLLASSI